MCADVLHVWPSISIMKKTLLRAKIKLLYTVSASYWAPPIPLLYSASSYYWLEATNQFPTTRSHNMISRTLSVPCLAQLLPLAPFSCPTSKMRGNCRGFASRVSTLERVPPHCEDEEADVKWDDLGFQPMATDYMFVTKCSGDQKFGRGKLSPFGNIQMSPYAGVLNYGQGLFEGTKAYRKENGHLLLFRAEENAIRMQIGAERMCMPSPSTAQFVDALKQTVLANRRWVPPPGKGSLYLRPLLLGTGPVLGVAPAPEYTFLVYASPVGNYFKEGTAPLTLYVEVDFDRASRRGAGSVKTISNYAPVMKAQMRAKKRGFSDVLYLDSGMKKNLEEVSASNIFIAKGKDISTPAANGTILPGITRKSVIEIARDHGYQVEERGVGVDELAEADEVFCTGTAVGVAPVGSITYQGQRMEYKTGSGTICQELCSTLTGIQTGKIEDKKGWVLEIQ